MTVVASEEQDRKTGGGAASAAGDNPRQRWIGLLAGALPADLEAAYAGLPEKPKYRLLRAPETGLVMLQGRMGGSGAPFNAGEMTVTRCSVAMADGRVGHGYVAGRAPRHAELAALFDALFQDPATGDELQRAVLPPLARAENARCAAVAAETAPTTVEFFTLVRGEG